MTKIEMGKKYKTLDGQEVIIFATDLDFGDGYTVSGGIKTESGLVSMALWQSDGQFHFGGYEHQLDLIEA